MEDLQHKPPERSPLTPPLTPPLLPQIPSWCPPLPAFTKPSTKWDELPLFFDLSKLPEPIAPQKVKTDSKCQQIQLWCPTRSPGPEKQRHIFVPPQWAVSKDTSLQIPQKGCRLHKADDGLTDAHSKQSEDIMEIIKRAVRAAERAQQKRSHEQLDLCPSKSQNVLDSPRHQDLGAMLDSKLDDDSTKRRLNPFGPPYDVYEPGLEVVVMPAELEAKELPFVHANSLTGYSNERASYPTNIPEDIVIYEAPVRRQDQDDGFSGLNEMVIDLWLEDAYADAILAAAISTPLPPTPFEEDTALALANCGDDNSLYMNGMTAERSIEENYADAILALQSLPSLPPSSLPTPEAAVSIMEPLNMIGHGETSRGSAQPILNAHVKLQEALAVPNEPGREDVSELQSTPAETHSIDCWCDDCSEPPALIPSDTLIEDDGWMVYSETDSVSSISEWEMEWGTFVNDTTTDHDTARTGDDRPAWDNSPIHKPSSVALRSW